MLGLAFSWLTGGIQKWIGIGMAVLLVLGTFGATMRRSGRREAELRAARRADQDYIDTRRRIDDATRTKRTADDARARLAERLRTVDWARASPER